MEQSIIVQIVIMILSTRSACFSEQIILTGIDSLNDHPEKLRDQPVEPLTRREREILALLAGDQSNQQIADQLFLSLSSVKWFARQIYQKLGVNGRREAISRARSLRLLAPLAPIVSPEAAAVRPSTLPTGTVTFLFTDIQGSTPLWEQHPEQMAQALQIHNTALRQAIEANAGFVFKTIGDAFQAAFPTALDGLKAAIEGQRALQAAPWNELGELKVRMGLHTGEASLDPGGDEYAISHTKNRIGRIHSVAHGGQILLSEETADLAKRKLPEGVTLKDLGEHRLKGIEWPEHLYQVVAPDLSSEFSPMPTAITHPNNLPAQLTSFIGREKEIDQVVDLLEKHRLVTLTGSGGTGKTRLALAVAAQLLDHFEHGVWLVELAPLTNPELVAITAAKTLGLHEAPGVPIWDVVMGFLKNKHLMLILDNCEHLLTECSSLVDTLLKACPRLHLLATSREILGVEGETTFRVPSLSTPDHKNLPPLQQFPQFDAVKLFVERAERVAPGFVLNENNAASVAAICQRLDGIPLAIELAAARMRVLPALQIATRLDNVFRLLTGGSRNVQPRQQTLKATMDWSYALLSGIEKLTLLRLSTFAGSWSLEAAESILPDEEIQNFEVLDLTTNLMDKSLIRAITAEDGSIRYRMLETVRQYAHDRLLENGGGEAIRDRHLSYYLRLGERAEAGLRGKDQLIWLDRLEVELDNLRLALDWSLAGHLEDGLRLASALMWFWHIHTHHNEAVQRLGDLLAAEAEARGSQILAVGVQSASYLLAWICSIHAVILLDNFHARSFQMKQKLVMIASSIALCRELGEAASRELAWGLMVSGYFTAQTPKQSILLFQESLAISRRKQYDFIESGCLLYLWSTTFRMGNIQQAKEYLEQSLAICRRIEDVDGMATCLVNLGRVAYFQGDYGRAKALIEDGQAYYKKAGNLQAFNFFYCLLMYITPDPDTLQKAEKALAFSKETQDTNQQHILLSFSEVFWSQGNFDQAGKYGQEAYICTQGLDWAQGFTPIRACLQLGRLALSQGDHQKAGQYIKMATLKSKKEISTDAILESDVLDALAVWLTTEGKMERSAQAFGALDEMYQRLEPSFLPRKRSEHQAALSTVRQALGEQAFTQAWKEGQSRTLGQAIDEVRQAEGWEEE